MPCTVMEESDFVDGNVSVLDMMVKAAMIKSKGEGRRLIQQGGISLNDEKVTDVYATLTKTDFDNDVIIKKGKKVFRKFTL